MTIVLKPARQHNYRLSAYKRKANDFYPTPCDLAIGLALGLPRLGLDLPRLALDPCGGDGALRRALAPFSVDVRLTDLYPELHAAAGGYLTREPLDASEPKQLRQSLDLAGAGCTAIITNTPHNTVEASAIVENAIGLAEEEQQVDLVAVLFRSIWGRRAGAVALSQPAVLLRRNPLLLAASVDPWERRKPDACLRVVRLAEGAKERRIFEGSRRQARHDRGPVSSEPAKARLTRETTPLGGGHVVRDDGGMTRPTTRATLGM
jgi:hypothetical protein